MRCQTDAVASQSNPQPDRVQARLAQQRAMVKALPASTKALLKVLCVAQWVAVFVAGVMTIGFLWTIFSGNPPEDIGSVVVIGVAGWLGVAAIELAGRALSHGAGNWGTAVWN